MQVPDVMGGHVGSSNEAFLQKQKEKYDIRTAIKQRKVMKGINPKAIKNDSEMMDFMKMSGAREDRIRKGHRFWDVLSEENLSNQDQKNGGGGGGGGSGGDNASVKSFESSTTAKSFRQSKADHAQDPDKFNNFESSKVNANAKNLLRSAADANNIMTLVDFDTISPIYYGVTLLIMNYIGEVLYLNRNNELRSKPLSLLQSSDRVKFKIVDLKHSNRSGVVHYGEQLWLQILENSEVGDINTFKMGVILGAKLQSLPLHDVETLSGAPASTSSVKDPYKKKKKTSLSSLPAVDSAEQQTEEERPTLLERQSSQTASSGGDIVGQIDITRIADVRRVENLMLDFNERDDYDQSKAKRSYISRQAHQTGRFCIHSAIRDEDLTEKQRADQIGRTSDNRVDTGLVCSKTPIIIQQDFYCLSTRSPQMFSHWPKESEDIVANTDIFTPSDISELDRWRRTNADYIEFAARKKNSQKHRSKPRAVSQQLDPDDDGMNVKKELSMEEKLENAEFACLRAIVPRKFPYEYSVDRKCVWKFLQFEQFASKDGENTEEDKIVHHVMETANMVLKLSKANREGKIVYQNARNDDYGESVDEQIGSVEGITVAGQRRLAKKNMKKYLKKDNNHVRAAAVAAAAAASPTATATKPPTPKTPNSTRSPAGGSHGSKMGSVGGPGTRHSIASSKSTRSALPALKSGETFAKNLRTITQINLADIEEKYTQIRRNKEIKLKNHFREKINNLMDIENSFDLPAHQREAAKAKMRRQRSERSLAENTSNNSVVQSSIATNDRYRFGGAGKPSRLAFDDDEYSDVNSQISGITGGGISSFMPTSHSADEIEQRFGGGGGGGGGGSASSMFSTWTPSEDIGKIFKLDKQKRLQPDQLLLSSDDSLKNYDHLSKGEQVLAMHTTFHHVMRQAEEKIAAASMCSPSSTASPTRSPSLHAHISHNSHARQRTSSSSSTSSSKGSGMTSPAAGNFSGGATSFNVAAAAAPTTVTTTSTTLNMRSRAPIGIADDDGDRNSRGQISAGVADKMAKMKAIEAEIGIVLDYHSRLMKEKDDEEEARSALNRFE